MKPSQVAGINDLESAIVQDALTRPHYACSCGKEWAL